MGWVSRSLLVPAFAVLLAGSALPFAGLAAGGSGSPSAGESIAPHDPLLFRRLVSAKRVTVQRVSGPPVDSCRGELVAPSDTIPCYPVSSVRPAPKGNWAADLLDLSSEWTWMRGPAGLDSQFAAVVGVRFRGDSLNADLIVSFEPMAAVIRVGGNVSASAVIPNEFHARLLGLVQRAFPKDAVVAGQPSLEEERHPSVVHMDRPVCDCWVEALLRHPYERIASPRDTAGCYAESPVPLSVHTPIYPEFAKEAQIQGTVNLHALISADGSVRSISVVQGVTGLDDAAVDAVRGWTFKPAFKAGLPVCTRVEVVVEFRLP